MDDYLRKVLDQSLISFTQDLTLRPILDHLQVHGIIMQDQREEIMAEKLESERRYKFISILKTRGPWAFPAFYCALIITGQSHLSAMMKPSIPPNYLEAMLQTDLAKRMLSESGAMGMEGLPNSPSNASLSSSESGPHITYPPSDIGASAAQDPNAPAPPTQEAISSQQYYVSQGYNDIEVKETMGLMEGLKVTEVEDAGRTETFGAQARVASANNNLPVGFTADDTYRNFTKPKGLAIIFNNRKFAGGCLPERLGTDVDARNLTKLFTGLGYHVKVKNDHSARDMKDAMARFALKDHDNYDSAVVIVLSHGLHGQIYGACGTLVPVSFFTESLNAQHCRKLVNKPKLFFLQACRGEKYDPGVAQTDGGGFSKGAKVRVSEEEEGGEGRAWENEETMAELDPLQIIRNLSAMDFADAAEMKKKVPVDADSLIAYATTPGFVSWRNSARGSWFVQALCEIFATHAHRDHILDLLTKVNNRVVEAFTAQSGQGYKQIPESANRLRKKFFFYPGVIRPAE